MTAQLWAMVIQLVIAEGPAAVNALIAAFKDDKTCPTPDTINALHSLLKDPGTYFAAKS